MSGRRPAALVLQGDRRSRDEPARLVGDDATNLKGACA